MTPSHSGSSSEYTTAQAARITGCAITQLRYWARTSLVTPDSSQGYSFRNLIALRVVRSLMESGLSPTRIRAALKYVSESGAEITELRIVTDGTNVWACRDDGQVLDALRHGQLAMFLALDHYVAELDAEVRTFDAERCAFVEQLRSDQHDLVAREPTTG